MKIIISVTFLSLMLGCKSSNNTLLSALPDVTAGDGAQCSEKPVEQKTKCRAESSGAYLGGSATDCKLKGNVWVRTLSLVNCTYNCNGNFQQGCVQKTNVECEKSVNHVYDAQMDWPYSSKEDCMSGKNTPDPSLVCFINVPKNHQCPDVTLCCKEQEQNKGSSTPYNFFPGSGPSRGI